MGDHYLPQLLLTGFASSGSNELKTFLFIGGCEPKLVSIRRVAQQKDFHGRRGQTDLEFKMGQFESAYASALRAARNGECAKYNNDIARLVANISVRTKNLRDNFADAAGVLFESLPEAVSTGKHLRKIRNQARKGAMKHFREQYPALVSKDVRKRLDLLLRSKLNKPELSNFVRNSAREFVAACDVSERAIKAHNEALGNTFADTQRVEHLKTLSWYVDLRTEPTWILGDVGCIAKLWNEETLCNVLTASEDEIEVVCLPISDKALLIGRRRESQFQLDAGQVNQASAELSQDFFVSSVITQRERALHGLLARRRRMMTDDEIRGLVRN